MRRDTFRLKRMLVAVIFVLIAGVLENTSLLQVAGIKPNISLAILITLSFFISALVPYLALVLLTGILLRFEPGFEFTSLIFTGMVILFFFLHRRLPGQPFLNNLILIASGTLIFYSLLDWRFVYAEPLTVSGEMLYNIILGAGLFLLSQRFIGYESRT